MVHFEPAPVVGDGMVAPGGGVHGLFGPLETPPGSGVAPGHAGILLPLVRRVEARLEVRLAEQRGAVAGGVVQVLRHRRRVDGERDPVGHHAVGADVLACQHGRPRRHAHRVLVVGPPVVDALGGQAVDDGRAGHRAPVAAEAVVALLVGGDEEDVAAAGGTRRAFPASLLGALPLDGSPLCLHAVHAVHALHALHAAPHPACAHSARNMRCRSSSRSSISSARSRSRSGAPSAASSRCAS